MNGVYLLGGGSKWITIKEAKEGQLGGGDKPDYFNTVATIIHMKSDNCVYKACPQPTCQKKVSFSFNQSGE